MARVCCRASRMGVRGEALARARAIRTRRIEAIALAVLALLPIVPHFTSMVRAGVPRYGLFGDHALLEQATRHVWSGDTLLGPRSRFDWNHPGPFFFYLAAPFQAIFRSSSTGLYIATCLINAVSAGGLAACMRLFARRAHAIAALLAILAWFVAFGNTSANPWNPLVVVLPFMAFLVNAALLGRGKSAALIPMSFFGTFAAQTHIAVAPTTIAAGLIAMVAFLIGAWQRGGLDRVERWRVVIAAAVVLVLFVPPLIEQVLVPAGNLEKIHRFFAHREAPLKPLSSAMIQWTSATTWLPERVFTQALVDDGPIPPMLSADAIPSHVRPSARLIAIVHGMSIAIAAIIAALRRDLVSVSLLGIGAVADATAMLSLRAVVGPTSHYLVFWTTAASTVAWIGVLSTVFSWVGALASRVPRISSLIAPSLVVLGLGATVLATSLQRFWLTKHTAAPSTHPELRGDLRTIEAALRERLQRDGATVVVHRDGASDIADALVLELEKDGIDVRVAKADREAFVGLRTGQGVAKPFHAWLETTAQPHRRACPGDVRELVKRSGNIALYGSAIDDSTCTEAN